VRPWTDFVEVYWHNHCQAYVTPVGENEVCVAMIASAREVRLSDLSTLFPRLAKRLCGAEPTDSPRLAVTMSVKLPAVIRGQVALVGDASGSVDAITGEGLALAFRQARFLATSLTADDLGTYDTAHRQIARLLLLMDGNDGMRRGAIRTLAACPRVFGGLLAFHVGALWPH
jgi:flavin-dependent dehydrogenase